MAQTNYSGPVDSVAGFKVNGTSVISSAGTVTSQTSIVVGTTTVSEAEIGVLDAVTPGTAAASKAVVLDSSKGIATITSATITTLTAPTVNATNVDAGASGTAGSVDVFPSTASKGKISLVAIDNTSNDTLTITNVAQAAARTYTLGDVGASAGFAMLAATPTATIGSTPAEIDQMCDASAQSDTRTGAGAISIDKLYTSLVTTAADALTLAAPGATSIPRLKIIHMTTDGGDGTLASTNIVGQSSGTTSITFNDAGDYLVLVSIPGLNKWSVLKEGGVTAA